MKINRELPSDFISIDYYNDLKSIIFEKLDDCYKSDEMCAEYIIDDSCSMFLDEYCCFKSVVAERGIVEIWNRDEYFKNIKSGKRLFKEVDGFAPKGPGRTAAMLFYLLKRHKYRLVPALIIICASDLYGKGWVCDNAYMQLRKFAKDELETDGFNSKFLYRAKYYIDDNVYRINTKYKVEDSIKNTCVMDLRKHLYQEPELLADYYSEHFREEFDNSICVYFHLRTGFYGDMMRRAAEIMDGILG